MYNDVLTLQKTRGARPQLEGAKAPPRLPPQVQPCVVSLKVTYGWGFSIITHVYGTGDNMDGVLVSLHMCMVLVIIWMGF